MRSSEYGLPRVLWSGLRPVRPPSFQHSEPPSPGHQYFRLARRLIACALLCQSLAACAVATPFGEGIDAQPTGSISASAPQADASPRLLAWLDEEDRRRALGALAIALDPQGNGASVRWDNPVSKAHGQITPIGFAYPSNDLICRKFSARFDTAAGARSRRAPPAATRTRNGRSPNCSRRRPGRSRQSRSAPLARSRSLAQIGAKTWRRRLAGAAGKWAYNENARSLSSSRRRQERHAGRYQKGLPQARQTAPPRPESQRSQGEGKIRRAQRRL